MAKYGHINPQIQQKPQITASEYGSKFQGKREVYRFLNSEVRCYLSGYESMTIWHLRDLGTKDSWR